MQVYVRFCTKLDFASPTFIESIRGYGEEGQLDQSLAEDERLEPGRRVHHHGILELFCIPPEKVFQLSERDYYYYYQCQFDIVRE